MKEQLCPYYLCNITNLSDIAKELHVHKCMIKKFNLTEDEYNKKCST